MLAIAVVVLLALDIPAKAARSAAAAVGDAGFTVERLPDRRAQPHGPSAVDDVVTDELRRAAEPPAQTRRRRRWSTSAAIRDRLLRFGWVKDARVSRRLPDTLVIDIVERQARRAVAEARASSR